MNVLDRIERSLRALFGNLGARAAGDANTLEPVEIRREILAEIGSKVQPRGGGEYLFPYTAVKIEIPAGDEETLGALESVLDPVTVAEDVRAALEERGVKHAPPGISVVIGPEAQVGPDRSPFRITYSRAKLPPREAAPRPRARLTVLGGKALVPELFIERDRVFIGRLREVFDKRTGIARRNDLAFDESETSVSRRHAVLSYEPDSGKFRLRSDPASQHGTRVLRDGGVLNCDAARGVQLRSGDEIHLGDARVEFEITE